MCKTEALLRTLFFIGMLLFILWAIQSHSAQMGLAIRPMYYILIILALIAVAPFVYRLSVKHLSKKKYTRDDYIKEATWCGCFALVFTVLAIFNLDDHKTVAGKWLSPACWTIATAIPLFMASKAKKTEYTRHE
jgi:hypothetical protein